MSHLSALLTAFGLGFIYFISAIPASVLAGASLWTAACAAWFGYFIGAATLLLVGAPFRSWLAKKGNLSFVPNEKKLFWRIWNRYGVIGLGLIAPFTIGSQIATLTLLALGVKPLRILFWISLGAIPSVVGIACIVKYGVAVFKI